MTTNVYLIVDESGSMEAVREETVSGIQTYLSGLREDKENDYRVSLTLFNTQPRTLYHGVHPLNVAFTEYDFRPSGFTALYDAIGETLAGIKPSPRKELSDEIRRVRDVVTGEEYEARRYTSPDKNICVIVTDGAENASRRYNRNGIRARIEGLERQGNWSFIYLGAHADTFAEAGNLGIASGNTIWYNSNATPAVYNAVLGGTRTFAAASVASSQTFAKDYLKGLEEENDDSDIGETSTGNGTDVTHITGRKAASI